VVAAAKRARAVQRAWAQRPISERAEVMLCLHDLVLQRQDEVLDIIQLENGKARRHAF
jgi:succinate-semialdehyde dehydrogenase/glutarate-semialdehyde dehydrogenase